MNRTSGWFIFLSFFFISILWYASSVFDPLYDYYFLTEKAPAENLKWFVEEISSDDFRVGASYSFRVLGTEYAGETIFSDYKFRNPSSADDELRLKAKEDRVVFFNPKNIDHSSLQKKFPTKECISLGLLILLYLYFVGLGIYARRF